jgi:hypothetical protein
VKQGCEITREIVFHTPVSVVTRPNMEGLFPICELRRIRFCGGLLTTFDPLARATACPLRGHQRTTRRHHPQRKREPPSLPRRGSGQATAPHGVTPPQAYCSHQLHQSQQIEPSCPCRVYACDQMLPGRFTRASRVSQQTMLPRVVVETRSPLGPMEHWTWIRNDRLSILNLPHAGNDRCCPVLGPSDGDAGGICAVGAR